MLLYYTLRGTIPYRKLDLNPHSLPQHWRITITVLLLCILAGVQNTLMSRCTAYQIRCQKQKIGKSELLLVSYETEANKLVQILKTQTYKPAKWAVQPRTPPCVALITRRSPSLLSCWIRAASFSIKILLLESKYASFHTDIFHKDEVFNINTT